MYYRADIDGLRAIAVLSVIAYHFGASLPYWLQVPGGFIGVDIFFVISGYLITSQLYTDISDGQFSILDFYHRRLRRILPALLTMLVVTLIAGKWLLMPGDYVSLASSTIAAAFGISNHLFLTNTGYFDRAAELAPLLHTWSLGVEEQFYFVWPIFLFVISRGSRRRTRIIVGSLVIILFAASLFWFEHDRKQAFFLAAPRAWELLIGGWLVVLPRIANPIAGNTATVAGLLVLSAGFAFVRPEEFPSFAALYPTLGAALVIWPRQTETQAAHILGFLKPIGLISYSLYLWHWPVWVMYRWYINGNEPSLSETMVLAIACLVLAAMSYFFIERPFRKVNFTPFQTVRIGFIAIGCVSCAAMYVHSHEGFPERISQNAFALRSLNAMWTWPCEMKKISDRLPPMCVFGKAAQPVTTLLWGDSNSEHIAPMLDVAAKDASAAVALTQNCAPVINGTSLVYREKNAYNEECAQLNRAILGVLTTNSTVRNVVISSSWKSFIDSVPGSDWLIKSRDFEAMLRSIVKTLLENQKHVTLVKTIPHWLDVPDPVPCALLNSGLLRSPCDTKATAIETAKYLEVNSHVSAIFEKLKSEFPRLTVVDPARPLCSGAYCVTSINGEFLYRDAAHFRRNLSDETNREIAARLGLDRIFEIRSGPSSREP